MQVQRTSRACIHRRGLPPTVGPTASVRRSTAARATVAAGRSRPKEKITNAHDPLRSPDRSDPDRDRVRPADLADALAYLRAEAARLGLDEVCVHLDAALLLLVGP